LCIEPQEIAEDTVKKCIPHQEGVLEKEYCPPLGEDDRTSTKKQIVLKKKNGSKIVRKVILKDSYHMMTIDNQRDRVAEEKTKFFRKQLFLAL
jgi:hypothetical protein